jgi:hypothetical protein
MRKHTFPNTSTPFLPPRTGDVKNEKWNGAYVRIQAKNCSSVCTWQRSETWRCHERQSNIKVSGQAHFIKISLNRHTAVTTTKGISSTRYWHTLTSYSQRHYKRALVDTWRRFTSCRSWWISNLAVPHDAVTPSHPVTQKFNTYW